MVTLFGSSSNLLSTTTDLAETTFFMLFLLPLLALLFLEDFGEIVPSGLVRSLMTTDDFETVLLGGLTDINFLSFCSGLLSFDFLEA